MARCEFEGHGGEEVEEYAHEQHAGRKDDCAGILGIHWTDIRCEMGVAKTISGEGDVVYRIEMLRGESLRCLAEGRLEIPGGATEAEEVRLGVDLFVREEQREV